MKRNSIAVLLTVFNRKDKTLKCLQRLYTQLPLDGYQVDVYLTDDGCTDRTPEAVRQQFPQVHIIYGDGNLFWNRGMYIAWQEAAKEDYDFYLWLNDDVILFNTALSHILSCSNKKKDKCIISGLISSTDGLHTTYGGRTKGIKIQKDGTMHEIETMHGNFVLIPKYVFQIIGYNDPYYHHSYGDHDYSLMARKKHIGVYTTKEFTGTCDIESKEIKCFMKGIPFKQRWKNLHSPLSYTMPNEVFYFYNKHYNTTIAIFKYISVYIKCLFPQIHESINRKRHK